MIPHTKGFYSAFFQVILSETGHPDEQLLLRSLLMLGIRDQHELSTVSYFT